jgi:hypothetical protein
VPPDVLPEDEAIRMEVNGLGSTAYGDRHRKLRAQKQFAAGFARAAIAGVTEESRGGPKGQPPGSKLRANAVAQATFIMTDEPCSPSLALRAAFSDVRPR